MSSVRVRVSFRFFAGVLLVPAALLAAGLGPTPASADATPGGGFDLSWWNPQISVEDDGAVDTGTLNGSAELWLSRKWGIRGARFETQHSGASVHSSDLVSVDLKRRFFSLDDGGFVGIGAGWGEIDLDSASSSGLRLTAEGRIGIGGVFSFYGQTSWLPELADAGALSNLEGHEFEAGLSLDPAPHLTLRLGFRRFRLDYEEGGSTGSTESEGVIFGAGYHW